MAGIMWIISSRLHPMAPYTEVTAKIITGISIIQETANEGSVSWWSASDSYKIGTVVITRENGVTTFSLKVAYSTLGIGAEDVFGVAMREASHNAGDHHLYDPWYDCYFEGGRIDAAASSQYVRVAADGTLYKAANNNKA